jgi:hypothetical protein
MALRVLALVGAQNDGLETLSSGVDVIAACEPHRRGLENVDELRKGTPPAWRAPMALAIGSLGLNVELSVAAEKFRNVHQLMFSRNRAFLSHHHDSYDTKSSAVKLLVAGAELGLIRS